MRFVLAIVLAALIGSIPFAFIAGKITKGIDLRRHGSGNLGATNVYRILGTELAVLVWIADTLKGATAVLLVPGLFGLPEGPVWPIVLGAVAILGHAFSLFLGRGGGKGVATATGVFLALAWLPTLLAIAAWGLVLWRTGYVSLASLVASVTLCVALAAVDGVRSAEFIAALAFTLFVFWSHRANITRLRNGEEHQFKGGPRLSGSGAPRTEGR